MKLRTINLSVLTITSLIATPLATISCQQKQIPLSQAVAVKDFGYVTDLTTNGIIQKLLTLNPNLEIEVGELMITILHNKALFSVHPAFRKKGKYRGNLEVKFNSYITPLYTDEDNEMITSLTKENPKYIVNFKITKDYPWKENFRYSTSGDTKCIHKFKEKINETGDLLMIVFELKEGVTDKRWVRYGFGLEDARFPAIIFEIN